MWGMGLDSWNNVLVLSLSIAAAAAIIVGISTFIVIQLQKQEAIDAKDEFDRYKIEAGKQIAGADARAAEANKQAAQANLELARLKMPRILNGEQQTRIADKLATFGRKQFDVALLPGDPDASALMPMIEGALAQARWDEIDWADGSAINFQRVGQRSAGLVTVDGLIVQIHAEHAAELWEPASALAAALTAEGVPAKAEPGSGTPNTNPRAIHILIGKKQ